MKSNRKYMAVIVPGAIALMLLFGVARLFTYTAPVPNPPVNRHNAAGDSVVSITYQQDVNATTVNSATFAVFAMQSGRGGAYSVNGSQIQFNPAAPFLPGELVQATATTSTLFLSGGSPVTPTV